LIGNPAAEFTLEPDYLLYLEKRPDFSRIWAGLWYSPKKSIDCSCYCVNLLLSLTYSTVHSLICIVQFTEFNMHAYIKMLL